ncbi:hypothetical protein CZ787_04820 [Halomonas citrativorans]|uniref:Uncharacterized protein n=1 Tax=Halomonas citrativorans TaxID=2742612 RepID=A0A1R4HTT3_9GAMM|nr:hypothetical protein CZ787_04820 [Halomonas citrativorans]
MAVQAGPQRRGECSEAPTERHLKFHNENAVNVPILGS